MPVPFLEVSLPWVSRNPNRVTDAATRPLNYDVLGGAWNRNPINSLTLFVAFLHLSQEVQLRRGLYNAQSRELQTETLAQGRNDRP